jgi:Uma2 family endonuclease
MAVATQRTPPRLSVELFRAFYDSRPDEEHWQLIDGIAVMMAPPTLAHQWIATNVQTLLNAALKRFAPKLRAFQRPGVNLGPSIKDYDPEPDVAVIDADAINDPNRRYADRFYLAAEIVSESDQDRVESKQAVYRLHEACKCILTIQQDRFQARIDLRSETGWTERVLTSPDDPFELTEFGLRCKLADLHEGTALQPSEHGSIP